MFFKDAKEIKARVLSNKKQKVEEPPTISQDLSPLGIGEEVCKKAQPHGPEGKVSLIKKLQDGHLYHVDWSSGPARKGVHHRHELMRKEIPQVENETEEVEPEGKVMEEAPQVENPTEVTPEGQVEVVTEVTTETSGRLPRHS